MKILRKGKEFSWNTLPVADDGIMKRAVSILLWMSPFLHLGIFFPLGVWVIFGKDQKLRSQSFTLIVLHIFIFILFYGLELSSLLGMSWETRIFGDVESGSESWIGFAYLVGLLFLLINYSYSLFEIKRSSLKTRIRLKQNKMTRISWVLLVWLIASVLSMLSTIYEKGLFFTNIFAPMGREKELLAVYILSLGMVHSWFSGGRPFAVLTTLFRRLSVGFYKRRVFLAKVHNLDKPSPELTKEVYKSARLRDYFLPGWGHIYAGDFWKGFPLLFIFLISIFIFGVAYFAKESPILGIQFLASWGLKPGIPDKEFFLKASSYKYIIIFASLVIAIYVFSKFLLIQYFQNLRFDREPQRNSLRIGFMNHLPISLLVHLIFLVILVIIPFTLQRQKPSDSKKDQAKHFQPENLEFYFIDPNIPDSVEDLNGGVITGTETPNQEQGEKISDEKVSDNGPVKGYVKKIKGKKVPATYSNYISAKMRGPESYLDYWRRAPKPYSSVVAYTITSDGYVEDVEIVEGSEYPDQDLLTIELIEGLSPLMSPPSKNGNDIRVTELFWNGTLDPDAMPTPLQKEMVTHFDGRYMEEIE
ncbi:energy transducer TonB [Leptospira sp. GIMC2001]|uniref:energy transducer TonB n=1 Tax=Leptospira sp. GIMC2001 TaxID=1513297 RepID=UPI0023497F01|nr:energy transducer TonB [Leptospira sp. GIMC2001]WCL48609.1 energy transducer TonB [Leptospira sp. GIMC2001]